LASYLAKSNHDWALFLRENNIPDNINFWSPHPKPLIKALPGNHIFFLAKDPPKPDGEFSASVSCESTTHTRLENAWKEFGEGNGAASLEEMIARLNSFPSVKTKRNCNSPIGVTVVDEVDWFDEPVNAQKLGVQMATQAVRGRTLLDEEVVVLSGPYSEGSSKESILNQLAQLNKSYKNEPPKTKKVISNRIERNPTVANLLKEMHPLHCQLCKGEFFKKKGGKSRYSEVHHLITLSSGGSQATDNCLVLCANCHRKMHIGDIILEEHGNELHIFEAGKKYQLLRNVLEITLKEMNG
jgi:predicted HNH restriction endonuclease